LDLASLSFQVPMFASSAKLKVKAKKHSTTVNATDLFFMISPV